jgi:18S rRNA (guanine1575-N7)-methyltransferase
MPRRTTGGADYEFSVGVDRPEELNASPRAFYTPEEIRKYALSGSVMRAQEGIARRILELAQLRPRSRVLDVGAGCGFSSIVFYFGSHVVVGIDLVYEMMTQLDAQEIDRALMDMGALGFRAATFDAVFSASALQWVFTMREQAQRVVYLEGLAQTLGRLLRPGGPLVMQFYPKNDDQMREVGGIFADSGLFGGQFVVDNPHKPIKRKIYLSLRRNGP